MSEKYHIQVKLYKEVDTNKYKFIKGFDSNNFTEEVAEYLYNLINKVETEVYNNQKQNGKFEVYKGLLDYAEKRIIELEKICTEDLASEVEHQDLFNTVTDLEKRIIELEKNESNFWKEKYLSLQKDYLDLKSKFDSLQSQYDFEINKPIIKTNWDTYKIKPTQDCRFAPDVK